MHPTAYANAKSFFDCYEKGLPALGEVRVIEIGSQDVNGSLRDVCPPRFHYTGVDFAAAKNVDVILTDPYKLPFEDETLDIIITSSCLEHSEMFWLVFLEMLRVLKPHGLIYVNAPSRGNYHRYPVDCWRFYPDSGMALVTWGKRSGFNPLLLESYIQSDGLWGDFVGVFLKDAAHASMYPDRIISTKTDFVNARQEARGDEILRLLVSNNGDRPTSWARRLVPKPLRGFFSKPM